MREVRRREVAKLVKMVRPTDVFAHAHTVQRRRLFDEIALGYHQHRHSPGQRRSHPEKVVDLVVTQMLSLEVDHDQPDSDRLKQGARLISAFADDHPISRDLPAAKLRPQKRHQGTVLRNDQNCGIKHAWIPA